MKNEAVVSVRCTKAERQAFRRAAKRGDRTLSAFMVWAARKAVNDEHLASLRTSNGGSNADTEAAKAANARGGEAIASPAASDSTTLASE
jgi:hypothetical protein